VISTRALVAAVACAVCAACAGVSRPNPEQLTAPRDRITDEALASDMSLIDRWQGRLQAAEGGDQIRYGEADAWLAAARQQYLDKDPTDNAVRSLDSAKATILTLEHDGPTHEGASPRRDSAQRDLGRLQVTMQLAGLANSTIAVCRAAWYRALSDSLQAESHRLLIVPVRVDAPVYVTRVADTAVSVVATVIESTPMPTAAEIALVPHSVHFAVSSSAIGVASRTELDRLWALLERYPKVLAELSGFADPRGDAERNLVLSEHRAVSVRDYLVAKGTDPGRVLLGYRAVATTTVDTSLEKYAHDRIVQINLIGTDGLPIKAESQDRDLQVEQARPRAAVVAKASPRRPATKTKTKSQP
jgi:outer membrane protein OmpA-like peptidoglycan-associated protein